MLHDSIAPQPGPLATAGMIGDDDIWPALRAFHAEGQRTAVVTLVSVDGGSPREAGAQMAIAEDGRYHGYLSGGCLEKAIALEASRSIATGQNYLERYGRGSKYMDIRLPCGSAMDLYFDCTIGRDTVSAALAHRAARRPFALLSDLSPGANTRSIIDVAAAGAAPLRTQRDGHAFVRSYLPPVQLILMGSGPGAVGIAQIASALGLALKVWTNDEATRAEICRFGIACFHGEDAALPLLDSIDAYTSVLFAFHDHDIEPPLIERALTSDAFYIGALGSRAVHQQRIDILRMRGLADELISRMRAPIGLIPGAKSKPTLAMGVVTDILADAKKCGFIS
ncbi:MAG: XdhC family protein [Hyphomicrobium sp.]